MMPSTPLFLLSSPVSESPVAVRESLLVKLPRGRTQCSMPLSCCSFSSVIPAGLK